jgi:hypothetical protein
MNKITAAVLAGCLLAAGALAATSTAAAAGVTQQDQQNGTITIATEQTDETLVVTLSASGGLAGYQANLTYDPDVVRFREATGLDFADPVVNNRTAGWVFLTQAAADSTQDPDLVRVTFDVVGNGDPTIGFNNSNTLLNDADAEVVDPGYETSAVEQVTVTTPTPTVTPTPTDSPTVSGDDTTESPTVTDATSSTTVTTSSGPDDSATATTSSGPDDSATATETPDGDDGLLSNQFLLGVGAAVGVAVLLGVGVLLGRRL